MRLKKVLIISGCEKDKFAAQLERKESREYIWNFMLNVIDDKTGYTIKALEE